MSYWYRLWTALTQLLNALLGGWPDESLSSRTWRNREKRGWRQLHKLIDALFFNWPDHCERAYQAELILRQMPPELRWERRDA